MELLSSFFAATKSLAPKSAGAVAIVTVILKFSPTQWIQKLGVYNFTNENSELIGFALLISSAILGVHFATTTAGWISSYIKGRHFKNTLRYYLERLTSEEKACLRRYFDEDTSTIQMPYNYGVAGALSAKQIIFRSSNISSFGADFPYSIQPVAQEILRKRPKLLE